MNSAIMNAVNRIDIYLKRVRQDAVYGDPVQGMADVAELGEIARRLHAAFEKEIRKTGYGS